MSTKLFTTVFASAFLIASAPVIADHNSKNGEGTANMPNDIHNTRVETLEANDSEAFRDFVRYGEGSTTVNRFESEETQPTTTSERKGKAEAATNQGESQPMNQNRVDTQTRNQQQSRVESRTRLEPRTSSAMRSDRSATSARDRGGRKGGRKR